MAPDPILTLSKCLIRPYAPSDAADLTAAANNPKIARFMRNAFPSPYTLGDAETWIGIASGRAPLTDFAICTPASVVVGGIGLKTGGDVEARTFEVGYWLGEPHWGQGMASEILPAFTRWAFANFPDVLRLEAVVFGGNEASMRVLVKAGYQTEGRRRRAGYKNGESFDMCYYGNLREECDGLA